jgi:hypothetical protein
MSLWIFRRSRSNAIRVTVPAVELDDDAEVVPQEVDLIAMDPGIGLEPGNALTAKHPEQGSLTGGFRSLRTTGEIEHAPKLRHATLPLIALQLSPELRFGGKALELRLGDDALQLLLIQ